MHKNSWLGVLAVALGIGLLALALHYRREAAEARRINGALVDLAKMRRDTQDHVQTYLDELEGYADA